LRIPKLQVNAALTVDLARFLSCAFSKALFVTASNVLQKSLRSAPEFNGAVDISGFLAYTLGSTAEIVPCIRLALRL